MINLTKVASIATLSIVLGSVAAQATSLIPNPANQTTQQGVNGYSVKEAYHSKGRFVQADNGRWSEFGLTGGANFGFIEQNRDDWSVYLRDNSRGVNIQIDIYRNKVVYSDDTGKRFDLYDTTNAFTGQH